MGTKVTPDDITNVEINSGVPTINENFDTVADEFDKVLYRDGSLSATGDLDMDSNRIINLPAPINANEAARYGDLAIALATLEAATGPTYASTAAGLAATVDGESFAVDNGDGSVSIYLNDDGVADLQRDLLSGAAFASTEAGKGASLVGLEGGFTVQDYFDTIDLLPDASGDGTSNDREHFDAITKPLVALMPGKTYYIASDVTVNAKVIYLGGKIKRASGATVTFAGGLDAPPGFQIFDLSNLTPTQGSTIRDSGAQTRYAYRLGSGSFQITGRTYLSWFMTSAMLAGADASYAITEQAYSGDSEKIIDVDCRYSTAWLGNKTSIWKEMKCVDLTSSVRLASGQNNIWGESGVFNLMPIEGLDVCEIGCYGDGVIDGNFASSYDVTDEFSEWGGYPSIITHAETSSNGLAIGALTGGAYEAPAHTILHNMYVRNVARNCIILPHDGKVTMLGDTRVEDAMLDHLIYGDQLVDLYVERVGIGGYARSNYINPSSGVINSLYLHSALTENPAAALGVADEASAIIQVRSDIAGRVKVAFDLAADLTHMDDGSSNRFLVTTLGNSASVEVSGLFQDTSTSGVDFAIFGIGNGPALNFTVRNFAAFDVLTCRILNGVSGEVVNVLNVDSVELSYRSASTTTAGALIENDDNVAAIMIRGLVSSGGQAKGYNSLIDITGDLSMLDATGINYAAFATAGAAITVSGTIIVAGFANCRMRVGVPSSGVLADVSFKNCAVGSAMTNVIHPTPTQTTIADPTGGATVDAEARAAINSILDTLQTIGSLA